MKNNIHYSPEALNDLDEIWEYIFSELCNPQAAERIISVSCSRIYRRTIWKTKTEYRNPEPLAGAGGFFIQMPSPASF